MAVHTSDRRKLALPIVLAAAFLVAAPIAFGADAVRSGAQASSLRAAVTSPDQVWDGFVKHLQALGKQDLLPAVEHRHDEAEEACRDAACKSARPDLSRGDALLGVLFKLSKELVVVDALSAQGAAAAGENAAEGAPARPGPAADSGTDARLRALLDKLAANDDPYVRAYAGLYAARRSLARGETREAAALLEKVLASDRVLRRVEARRELTAAYRKLGEETLAILELQFLLAELGTAESSDRLWAEEELRRIAEHHKGPLHDCVDRKRAIASLLTAVKTDGGTQAEQRKVEDILEKVARILEDRAGRCASCMEKLDAKTGQCKSGCKACGACTAKTGGACPNPGCSEGQLADGSGKPRDHRPTENPAEETRFPTGKQGEPELRDLPPGLIEAWGAINDREVQRSLRELWGKIPPSYRELVAEYYKDIAGQKPAAEKTKTGR